MNKYGPTKHRFHGTIKCDSTIVNSSLLHSCILYIMSHVYILLLYKIVLLWSTDSLLAIMNVENQLDKSMHRNDSQTSCSFRRLGWKFQKSFQDYKGNRRLILCIDVNTQYYYFNINGNFDFENWEYPFYTIILKTIFKPCWEMYEN